MMVFLVLEPYECMGKDLNTILMAKMMDTEIPTIGLEGKH